MCPSRCEFWREKSKNKKKDITKFGGKSLVEKYDNSIMKMLQSLYPNHTWYPWKHIYSEYFWDSLENQRQYLDWLGNKLNITDWYKVSVKVFK